MAEEVYFELNGEIMNKLGDEEVYFQGRGGATYEVVSKTRGYFNFDGNNIDWSDYKKDAVIGAYNTYVDGKYNQGLNMVMLNSNGYKAIQYHDNYDNWLEGTVGGIITECSGVTMGAWFKWSDPYMTSVNSGLMYIGASNSIGFGVFMSDIITGELGLLYGGHANISVGFNMVDGDWTHVMFTLDDFKTGGNNAGKVYINGTLYLTYSARQPYFPDPSKGIQIGCMVDSLSSVDDKQFSGVIDDFFVEEGTWDATKIYNFVNT